MKNILILTFLIIGFSASAGNQKPTDKNATPETVKLYHKLLKLQKKGLMFGHQEGVLIFLKNKNPFVIFY